MKIGTRVVLKVVGPESRIDAEGIVSAMKILLPDGYSVEVIVVSSHIIPDFPFIDPEVARRSFCPCNLVTNKI